jgi:hypothetical protein
MTRDEATAHALCREAEPVLCRMGVVTTAHYDAMIPLIAAALAAERSECARLAEAQPYYHDTHTGMRQQWVKTQIAAAIRARGDAR